MFKKVLKSVSTSGVTYSIFWFLVSYYISFLSYKTQENTKEDPDNPEPAE